MNPKNWAAFFIFLLSSEYTIVCASSGASAKYEQLFPLLSRSKRQDECELSQDLVVELDASLERVRGRMDDGCQLDDTYVDNYEMTSGVASGFTSFRRTKPYRCACGKNSVRVLIEVSFLRIVVTYVMNTVDGLLGGLLGRIGTSSSRILGNVVNLMIRIMALDMKVIVVIMQKFVQGKKCVVEEYRVTRLSKIELLNMDLSLVADRLSPILVPALDLALRLIFMGKMRENFVSEFEQMIIYKSQVNC